RQAWLLYSMQDGNRGSKHMTVIEVTDLVKRYGAQTAVDGVSFSVEQGEIFGILGPNGAGKTTTVESIAGLRTPDAGTIRVLRMDPPKDRGQLATRSGCSQCIRGVVAIGGRATSLSTSRSASCPAGARWPRRSASSPRSTQS